MKILQKITPLFILTVSLSTSAADIKEGIYAPRNDNNGFFANYGHSICAGMPADFCSYFEDMKLSEEEARILNTLDSTLSGDINIKKIDDNSFKVSANFYVTRVCYVSTSSNDEGYGKYSPITCNKLADKDTMECNFFEPNDGYKTPVIIDYSKAGELHLSVKNIEQANELFGPYCFQELSSTTYYLENNDTYNHQDYLVAKLNFLRADAEINSVWKQLSKNKRKELLPEQRLWIKNKDKTCNATPKQNATEKELTVWYKCQSEFSNNRVSDLKLNLMKN